MPVADAAVPRLELREWAERYGIVAGITARPLSLGLWSDESVGEVMERWRALRTAFAPRFPALVLSHQVHATEVRWHAGLPDGWLVLDGVDGHATSQPGTLLTITVADCVPVYLAAPEKGTVALLHAGWRGTAGRVLEKALRLVCERTSVRVGDVIMHCGVGICGACYEVGYEVSRALGVSPEGAAERCHVDLRGVLARQAEELGIRDVTASSWCSAHDRGRFFSHRASGGRDGRMLAYLGFPLTH